MLCLVTVLLFFSFSEIIEECCSILKNVLLAWSPAVGLDLFKNDFDIGLKHPSTTIQCLCLRQVTSFYVLVRIIYIDLCPLMLDEGAIWYTLLLFSSIQEKTVTWTTSCLGRVKQEQNSSVTRWGQKCLESEHCEIWIVYEWK